MRLKYAVSRHGDRMKRTATGLVLAFLLIDHTEAAPLTEVGGLLDSIPAAQAMATADLLGEWRLPTGGGVRVLRVMSRVGGECGVSGIDDANACHRYVLLVSAFGETSVPVDFTLFKGPETLGWKVPKIGSPDFGSGKFTIPLLACEMKKNATGFGWKGTSYVLRVGEDLKVGADGYGHFRHDADLEKLPEEKPDCASYYSGGQPPPPTFTR